MKAYVKYSLILILGVLALSPQPADAQGTPAPIASKLVSLVNNYLDPQVTTHGYSGAVFVASGTTVLLDRGYGNADEQRRIPNGPNTVFPIESLTKAFTAAAILQLKERGQLRLTDHLCRFVVPCPDNWKLVTLEELLTMTSGLPDGGFIPDEDMTSPARAFGFLGRQQPLSTPGTTWMYNNFGYDLLGYVMQRLTHMTYWDYVKTHFFRPLGMRHSGFLFDLVRTPNHALTYHGTDVSHPFIPNAQTKLPANMSFLDADASITSTANDLGRWNLALNTTQILSKQDLRSMFTAHVATNAPAGTSNFGTQYGFGWFIGTLYNHRLQQHRGGGHLGWAYTFRFPDQHITLIVLSNRPDSNSDIIMTDLSRILLTKHA